MPFMHFPTTLLLSQSISLYSHLSVSPAPLPAHNQFPWVLNFTLYPLGTLVH